jgi:Asp-tRNA(Asn)/Glu-tRNA(Gln) amidotransferase A subunit family amidase
MSNLSIFGGSKSGFLAAAHDFQNGTADPVSYLEHCLTTIEARESVVKAWVSTRFDDARKEAAAAAARYRDGRPLSAIDGLPIGIKDLIATKDLPTGLGIPGYHPVPIDDSATIQALRNAGAIILGKATTTELGGATPSVTTNPFDPARTPGGSSSGSAAAVGAGMVPVALGTQVGGSILRPAAFCGNFAIKPTLGALHRGERLGLSHACIGVHACNLEDLWCTAVEVGSRCGGDPGYPGLFGEPPLPEALPIRRLAVLEGAAWDLTSDDAKIVYLAWLARVEAAGVELVRPGDDPLLGAFHDLLGDTNGLVGTIVAWENRSLLANLMARIPEKLSAQTAAQYEFGRKLSLEDYRKAIVKRDEFRHAHAKLAAICDAIVSLSAPGIAPLIDDPARRPGDMATGNPIYNVVPSVLGAPALTLPLLSLNEMPLGIQLIGQWHEDQQLVAHSRWLTDLSLAPIGQSIGEPASAV